MKKIMFLLIMFFYIVGVVSCTEDGSNENESFNPLAGTKWKLVGAFNTETNELIKEFEPKDCEDCENYYLLSFGSDTIKGSADTKLDLIEHFCIGIGYKVAIDTTIQITWYFISSVDGWLTNDGLLYANILYCDITKMSLKEEKLKLYNNDSKNYLLYKEVK